MYCRLRSPWYYSSLYDKRCNSSDPFLVVIGQNTSKLELVEAFPFSEVVQYVELLFGIIRMLLNPDCGLHSFFQTKYCFARKSDPAFLFKRHLAGGYMLSSKAMWCGGERHRSPRDFL